MALRSTTDYLYAVGQISYKKRMCLRRGAVRDEHKIVSFTLDLLVLTRMKTKKDREIERAVIKKKDQRRGQLGIDGVKLVEDHLTVLQVILMGPVARRTSQYGIIQNIVIDKTTFANFFDSTPTGSNKQISRVI